jgi:hypothetical protein
MLRHLRTYPILAGAVLFGLILSVYLFVHELVVHVVYAARSSALGQACTDPSIQAPKDNPNKVLFISCGGFLE